MQIICYHSRIKTQSENAPDEDTLHGVCDELSLSQLLVPVLVTHTENLLLT